MSSACRPTFYKIYKKKSSQGFHSIPYVTALMSAMLLLYYGFLKTNATLIITINAIGITIELVYLSVYLFYSPSRELVIFPLLITTIFGNFVCSVYIYMVSTTRIERLQMFTVKMLVCSLGGYGAMMLVTEFWLRGSSRMNTIGWICAVFNIAVFAAPLSIVRNVIKTKSVEYMPFTLSLFLTLCATAWFFYGLLVNDYYIALPNVLGFLFGITQMILYMVYKDATRQVGDGEMSKQEEEANNVENHFIEMGSVAHNKHNG
ncbi:Bidirectional sugar transporter NEC1 [Linum grandiflorum]